LRSARDEVLRIEAFQVADAATEAAVRAMAGKAPDTFKAM
jgi:hypothetical protein